MIKNFLSFFIHFVNQLFHDRHDPTQPSVARKLHMDIPLLMGILCIMSVGLIVLFSAAGEDLSVVVRQCIWFLLAFVVMFILAQFHPGHFKLLAPWLFGISLFLLLIVLAIGYTGKGATRWLDVGLLRFQPSEIMKLAMPMMLSWYFSERSIPPTQKELGLGLLLILLPTALIAKQPDLGTAITVAASGIVVMLFSGIKWRYVAVALILVGVALPFVWHHLHDYQRERVYTFLDPESDPLGSGYHIIQSKIAIGSAGFLGKGWRHGTQTQLDFLPEHATDFIYAVLSEEFGLLGSLLLLCLYAFVCIRCLSIAYQAPDTFSRLLAASLGVTFFISVFVNIGMVCGMLPVVGMPLPLFSYGGTSIVTLMANFGVLMSISSHRKLVTP